MKNLSKLISIILMLLLCSQSVTAAAVGVVASCNDDLVTLDITADGDVIVKLIEYGVAESEYNSPTKPPLDIDYVSVDGQAQHQLRMPTSTAGKYTVIVTDENGDKASDSFLFAILANASGILEPISKASNGDEIYELINNSAASLAIDTSDEGDEDYKAYAEAACAILYGVDHDFASVPELKDALYTAIALAAMKGSEADVVKSYLEKYQLNLGIDFEADFEAKSDAMKTDLLSLYASTDFAAELTAINGLGGNPNYADMCAVLFDRLTALSAVRTNTGGYLKLKKLYETDYNAILGSILSSNSDYNSNNAEAVFEELADSTKYKFNKFSDLAFNFNSAVSAGTSSKPQPPSGGGNYSVPSGAVNKGNDYESDLSASSSGASNPDAPLQKPTTYAVPTLGAATASYYDMPSSHWATESVSILGTAGIIAGYEDGSYRPDNSITRAEFAKLVVSAFSVNATEKNDFADVASTDWYAPFVAKAAGSGLINGYDGKFNPDGNISRQDAALILYRMAALAGVKYSGNANFSDITDIDIYAITAVRGLANARIITGDQNYRFNPKNNLSRAEAAKLLCGLITDMAKVLN